MGIPEHVDLLGNPTPVIRWLEKQDEEVQQSQASTIFDIVLGEAAQPKSVSGNACVRLCGFVERASKAQSEELQQWAFSQDVTLKLYDFYIDWNEFDHHRSMRLVLDLIAQLLGRSPDEGAALATRDLLLDNLISIVVGRSTKPVAKSALKTLDYFLVKRVFDLDDIKAIHLSHYPGTAQASDSEVWRIFMTELLQWTRLHFICPAAGKFIVSLYRRLRRRDQQHATGLSIDAWQQWLLDFLVEEPTLLEQIKNYIFLPLFKADRAEALKILQKMNENESAPRTSHNELDIASLLSLAALETGKKVGLVEEPYLRGDSQPSEESSSIILHETALQNVLAHPSHEVRTSALTLLISSPSTTRPYSSTTLDLLKMHLGTFFADPDAKFRVDVCARARDMFKRVRGAISVLKRSIPRARAKSQKITSDNRTTSAAQPTTYRNNVISLPEAQLVRCLEDHEKFLHWYMGFLCAELTPTASYQRHIAALKSLVLILRIEGETTKAWETPDDQQVFFDRLDDKWMRALLDLIMDPFDDVREMSSIALMRILSDERYRRFTLNCRGASRHTTQELEEFLQRADHLSIRTARADHSDGVARASQLLYKFLETQEQRLNFLSRLVDSLDYKITVAEKDLGRAVLEYPLHSSLASLCFTWQAVSDMNFPESELESVSKLQERLVACCGRIWQAVQDILCDDSPEGHLPQELEEMEGLDTKELLSYSFRAIHESSNLMRVLALTVKNRSREGFVYPSQKLFTTIGNLAFSQLSSLRHRGAFTTVALTFATCCQLTKHLDHNKEKEPLLELWYKGTMTAIFTQSSSTRRSAGIPSLMTGILLANASHPSFEEVMERLIEFASVEARATETNGSNLPQVHAYNCLKDIFKNSLLASMGNKSERYLPQCLELAASGLRSEVWAIRNCGLIFLRSLIDNLFGSQESKTMIEAGWDGKANRIPYHRYPNLPKVLATLLKSSRQMVASTTASLVAESVFPALDIIRRAGPPDMLRDKIQVHVATYLSSVVWHVREIAARTLCSCLLHDRWLGVIKGLFQEALGDTSPNAQNHIHGVLLALKFVFERLSEVSSDRLIADLPELIVFLEQTQIDARYINCPDVVAAYLEVVNMICMFQISTSQPLQLFKVSMPSVHGSALLTVQKVLSEIFSASQKDEPIRRVRTLLMENHIGADTLVTALEAIPKLWHSASTTDTNRLVLCSLYIDTCLTTELPEAQAVALHNLAELMDHFIHDDKVNSLPASLLVDLWAVLPLRSMNPALSNATIRVSGGALAAIRHAQGVSASSLRNWGLMMADAGLDDRSFNTRLAAAESLRSFFNVAREACTGDEYQPALLALYDSLNDDDDEVREVGSAAARSILGQNLVPIEAANRLLAWLAQHFSASTAFKSAVVNRIVGGHSAAMPSRPLQLSADAQLAAALKFDDSLFAVEEQNLFLDEVRETKRWISVFESLCWETSHETLLELDRWIYAGLARLQQLLEQEDGPLGWASNPQVFAICTRIIRGAVALSKACSSHELQQAVVETIDLLRSQERRVSRLLIEPFKALDI